MQNSDVVILMTPHKKFQDLNKIKKQINNSQCLFVDLFGFWEETRQKGFNGILQEINLKVKKGK